MVRLYKHLVRALWMMLRNMSDRVGADTLDDLWLRAVRGIYSSEDMKNMETDILPRSFGELIKLIDKVSYGQRADQDIIDLVVTQLQLPWIDNMTSMRKLKALRRALLLPEELNKLREVMNEQEFHCPSCGSTFQIGEMCTITKSDTGGLRVVCAHCTVPTSVSCLYGKHKIGFRSSGLKAQMLKCEECSNPKLKVNDQVVQEPQLNEPGPALALEAPGVVRFRAVVRPAAINPFGQGDFVVGRRRDRPQVNRAAPLPLVPLLDEDIDEGDNDDPR